MIVAADVLIGNVEHTVMPAMIDTVQDEYGATVETVMGDTAYSGGENLTAMEQREIELLAPLAEPKCKDNLAIRDEPSGPVADIAAGWPPPTQRSVTNAANTPAKPSLR